MVDEGWAEQVETTWVFPRQEPERAASLAETVGTSPLLAQVLLNRGISRADEARSFLNPRLTDLKDPDLLPDMQPAVSRLARAVREREPVVVFGDYDADGISATALLVSFLSQLGAPVEGVLPDRLTEGYGLNAPAVRRLAAKGTRLLVTVDHGTTAVEEIALAREQGLDVLVLDHHTPSDERPPANALVNPLLAGGSGPHPCGVGVAFKVAWRLARELAGGPRVAKAHRSFLMEALALVALGTVADVVPLMGENRILTVFGCRAMSRSRIRGLRALLDISGLGEKEPTAGDLAFKLAPRINAAGRLGRAGLALELLTTETEDRAREIASILDRENLRRREIQRTILDRARERLVKEYSPRHPGAFILGDPDWHSGVIGIVASRLVDLYHRPVALVAFDGDLGRGSLRSIPGLHITQALSRCAEHLESYGGHAMAAGLSVRKPRFENFRTAFDKAVRDALTPADLVKSLRVDVSAPLSSITPALVKDLERLAPFGAGNPRPLFATRGVRVAGRPRRLGREGRHLSFLAGDSRISHRVIGFRMGPRADLLKKGSGRVDIAYTPAFDTWRGDGSLELELRDVVVSPR